MVKKNEDCDKQETKTIEHFIVGMWKNRSTPIILKIYVTFIFIIFSIVIVFIIFMVLTAFVLLLAGY